MQQQVEQFILKGMQRDTSISKVTNEFSFENMNIRITAREDNTLLSITNEKGNKAISLIASETPLIPNKLSVEYYEGNDYRVVAQYPVETDIEGSAFFYDIDGEFGSTDYWTIKKGATSFEWRAMLQEDTKARNITILNTNQWDNIYAYYSEDDPIEFPEINIEGEILGYTVINNYIALFTKSEASNIDFIYKVKYDKSLNYWSITKLYSGDLNFSIDHPIETLALYENEDIQKVYWVDGINQLRMVNIVAKDSERAKWSKVSFDAVPILNLEEEVSITRNNISNGIFAPGVIQYVLTYYNKYGQESNPFYISPLYYTSYQDRGGSPEDKVSNSFNIKINNLDSNFDYVRIYSLLRTSIDATPLAKRVVDLSRSAEPSKIKRGVTDITHSNLTYYSLVSSYGVNNLRSGATVSDFKIYKSYAPYADNTIIPVSEWENTTISESSDGTTTIYYCPFNHLSNLDYNTIIELPTADVTKYASIDHYTELIIHVSNTSGEIVEAAINSCYFNYDVRQPSFSLGNTLSVTDMYSTEYNDDGTTGETIDPTELLYVGGENITAETITQKDNTLFLGNLKLNNKEVSEEIRNAFSKYRDESNVMKLQFKLSKFPSSFPDPEGYYPYENQLKYNSLDIKTFKYLEWYRFGVQFQNNTGKWSEPIWVADAKNNVHLSTSINKEDDKVITVNAGIYLESDLIQKITDEGFIKIRPVVVYPTFSDRECICQGVLCPTVYNMQDRLNNYPFAQSSWFVRPFYTYVDSAALDPKGSFPEFRHNKYLPSSLYRNAEIQNIYDPVSPYLNLDDYTSEEDINEIITQYVRHHSENFYVDQSIVTLHSPEIEFDDNVQNLDTEGLSLRIVGIVPMTSHFGDIDIQTSTPQKLYALSNFETPGFYHYTSSGTIDDFYGDHSLISGVFWMDAIHKSEHNNDLLTGYPIYPWHRNGSLNNQRAAEDNSRSAMLQYKKLSNLKVSYNSIYSDVINIVDPSFTTTPVVDTKIFNSNEVSILQLKASNGKKINYSGNIDTVLTFNVYSDDDNHTNMHGDTYTRAFGYPIIKTKTYHYEDITVDENTYINTGIDLSIISDDVYRTIFQNIDNDLALSNTEDGVCKQWEATDPIRMKYKSSPHAVIVLSKVFDESTQLVLPVIDGYLGCETINGIDKTFWDTDLTHNYQEQIDPSQFDVNGVSPLAKTEFSSRGYLWLGELYNPNVINRFGGQTQEAFENNKWLPCGEPISLLDHLGNKKIAVEVLWTEGDTYYQRYDHVKTYPFTNEDQNSISEIVSFMCETRINLDGRYDKNRGNLSNFVVSPENFNKINNVYSQENNFFKYRALNYDKFSLDNFANSIIWTKEKQLGELVDTWTNIIVGSTLDLDGEKGEIASLNTFNNEIFAFQKHGISHVLFNSRVQIPASDGAPIEITNGLKVDGKRYVSEIGCHNKWSIAQSPNGIYFIDNISNGIYLFTGQSLEPISEKLGFSQWVGENGTMDIWNKEYKNFRTFYDKVNGDVYFTTKDTSLCFSETLGQFTSFMNYENLPAMFNVGNKFYSMKNNIMWEHNSGDYNYFYGEYKPYYIKYRVNPKPYKDKIFTNIEFRADTFNDNVLTDITFNKLLVENEYQQGELELKYNKILPSTLKKKFRMWRTNIPRDKSNKRDRIRNPWIYLQLLKDVEDNYKTEFHDLLVYYFD